MKSVFYIISIIFLFITFLLIKKSEKKISILKFCVLNIIVVLTYNTLICFILNTINIPIKLEILTVINVFFAILFLLLIIKNKEIQKFYFNNNDIVAIIFIIFITIIAAYLNFGFELNIKYIMTDAAVHFSAAREFYENEVLVDKLEGQLAAGPFLMGAYTNTGILFKVFSPVIGEMNLYKIFILFDLFIFCLIGLIIYMLIEELIKGTWKLILSLIITTFFMFGYPFNSLIYGFVYLQLGILIIGTILNFLKYYDNDFNKKYFYAILCLLNFGIFFTYCIFVPIIYLVEFIYILKKRYEINKKIFTIKNFLICLIIFAIPILLGIYYFVIPHLSSANTGEGEMFLNIEGYIYRNCWSNFIFVAICAFLGMKEKSNDTFIWKTFMTILVVFMLTFFISIVIFHFATYYYYKFNFILWFMLWYGILYTINTIKTKKENIIIQGYIIIYMIVAIAVTHLNNVNVTKEIFDNDENITNAFDIYGINKTITTRVIIDYVSDEIKLVDYVRNNIDLKENNILLIANPRQEYWFRAFLNYKNRDDLQSLIPVSEVERWNNKEYKYLLVFYGNDYYKSYKDIINYKNLIMENETGAIYVNN